MCKGVAVSTSSSTSLRSSRSGMLEAKIVSATAIDEEARMNKCFLLIFSITGDMARYPAVNPTWKKIKIQMKISNERLQTKVIISEIDPSCFLAK